MREAIGGCFIILLRQWLIVTILSLRDDRSISLSLIQLMYAGVIIEDANPKNRLSSSVSEF